MLRRRLAISAFVSLALAIAAWHLLLYLWPPPDPYRVKPPGRQVFARDGTLLRGFLSPDGKWRLRVSLDEMSPHLVAAVLQHEDRWFYRHPGVNPVSVVRSAWTNLRAGRVVTGASTITMQLARLVEPSERSLAAKLRETLRALQYETRYSKDQILEMYLNLAPYGGAVEGVAVAARVYFDKPPSELSVAEASLLAVLPESPARRNPVRHPEVAARARDRLIDRLEEAGTIDGETARMSRRHPLPHGTYEMPFAAPHFCEWALRGAGREANLWTTLDSRLQGGAEEILRSHALALASAGVREGAVVILDYVRSELLAMVGSADYFDSLNAGQVNGAVARRSPGSALKPFVYALAFDRGLATPSTLIEDVPVRFGSYVPENYDRRFRGAMSAREALRTSRNVPAVLLASRLRPAGLVHDWLRRAGVASLDRSAEHYGLSLVLGGGDLTLLELTDLYATLARQGLRAPLRVRSETAPGSAAGGLGAGGFDPLPGAGADLGDSIRVLSREAAYLTLCELVDVERPELARYWRSGKSQVPIPWKTGTSYGHRDAWSVGVAGNYAVGVWLGNFDGVGAPGLVGRDVAAPLLFDLVELLPRDEPGTWHRRPPGLSSRKVCASSGAVATRFCPETRKEPFIPGVSPAVPCDVHREILVDTKTGYTVCSRCRTGGGWERRVVTWWPPQIATFMAAESRVASSIPPHTPTCPVFGNREVPVITSPQAGMEYHIRPGVPVQDQRIALLASVSGASREIYWFLDGVLVSKGEPGRTTFWEPTPGRHVVTVKDDAGRLATRSFDVVGAGASR
jgi:penicillin-binding protein 1C